MPTISSQVREPREVQVWRREPVRGEPHTSPDAPTKVTVSCRLVTHTLDARERRAVSAGEPLRLVLPTAVKQVAASVMSQWR